MLLLLLKSSQNTIFHYTGRLNLNILFEAEFVSKICTIKGFGLHLQSLSGNYNARVHNF